MPILTHELIESGMSRNGGWSAAQLRLIVPPEEFTGNGSVSLKKGWKQRLVGAEINQATYEQFLSLKDKHLERKFALQAQKRKQLTFESLNDPRETDLYPGKPDITEEEEQMLRHLASIKVNSGPAYQTRIA